MQESALTLEERAAKEERFAALLADKQRRREEEREAEEQARASSGIEEERKPLLASLAAFLRFSWSIRKPGVPLIWSWHYELLGEYLELFYRREILYLIVNIPPRTLKSEMLSVAFPAWVWAKDPLPSFIGGSFDMDLSAGHNGYRKTVIESREYQRLFGFRVQPKHGMWTERTFGNTSGGEMRAASPGSGITGRGGDFLLLDDILSPAQSASPTIGPNVKTWVDETFMQRRNDLSRSPLALIEQRVHEEDMTAHLLSTLPAEDVKHISIPLVAEEETAYTFPISKRIHVRPAGDVLMPEMFTSKVVAALQLRSRVYLTQYQGKPVAKSGKIFKREWFRYYGPGTGRDLPIVFDEIVQSWDCTFKDTSKSDLVACHIYGRKGADKYLLDRIADQMSFTDTLKAIIAMRRKWPRARRIYIEDKANGPAIIDVLKKRIGGIIPVEPLGSKEARAEAASADMESGNVFFPHASLAPWISVVEAFLLGFPGPLNDDDVDCYSQAINKMTGGRDGLFGMYENQLAREEDPMQSIFDLIEN